MKDTEMDNEPNIASVINENMALYNLLRKLFYYRLPVGNKMEEFVADKDFGFWQEIYKMLHKEMAQGSGQNSQTTSQSAEICSDMEYWANHWENTEKYGIANKVREWISKLLASA